MPAGRPTKYDPEFHPKSFVELSKQGKLLCHICAEWDIDRTTLWEWSKDPKKPEFSNAVKKGQEYREANWVDKGLSLMNNSEGRSTTPWIFIMKNAFRWTDRQEVQENLHHTKTIKVDKEELSKMPADELAQLYKEKMKEQ